VRVCAGVVRRCAATAASGACGVARGVRMACARGGTTMALGGKTRRGAACAEAVRARGSPAAVREKMKGRLECSPCVASLT